MHRLKGTYGFCQGFTLVELMVSLVVMTLVMAGVMKGYTLACKKAEWASYSLAAQQTANKRMEQAIACDWIPGSGVDDLIASNFPPSSEFLSLPTQQTNIYNATNYLILKTISTNPPLKMVRVDCVWLFEGKLFSNTVATIRAPTL